MIFRRKLIRDRPLSLAWAVETPTTSTSDTRPCEDDKELTSGEILRLSAASIINYGSALYVIH